MRKRAVLGWMAIGVIAISAAAEAEAGEPGVVKARLDLDRAERGLARLRAGDTRTADKLLESVHRAKTSLTGCKDHSASDWKTQARRAQSIGAKIQAKLGKGAPPNPTAPPKAGSSALDAPTRAAQKLVDEVAAALPKLAPGDVPAANALLQKLNSATGQLSKSPNRKVAAWVETYRRLKTLDASVRKLAAKPRAKGTPALPPAAGTRPKPGSGQVRAFNNQRVKSVNYSQERREVDALRWEAASKLVGEIERLVGDGKRVEAKVLLWGLWAECERVRRFGVATEGQADAAYQRARDACFGSAPVMRTDDGPVEVATQVAAARGAMKSGDVTTATQLAAHVKALLREGLTLPADVQAQVDAMNAEQAKAWEAGNEALRTAGYALLKCGMERGKHNLEDRVYSLYDDRSMITRINGKNLAFSSNDQRLLNEYENLVLGVTLDVENARKALSAFAAAPLDPDFVDRSFAINAKRNPKSLASLAYLLGAIRGAVFADALYAEWGLPRLVWNIYLQYIDACLSDTERHYQRDETKNAKAKLVAAARWIAHAKKQRAPEAELERRRQAVKELEGAAGTGKLKRAERLLATVETSLGDAAKGSDTSLDYARAKLKDAEGWITQAKKGGVPPADLARVEGKLAQLKGPTLTATLTQRADRPLDSAEERIAEAKKHVGKAERAFDAMHPLYYAKKRLKEAAPLIEAITDASAKAPLAARAEQAAARVASLTQQVAENQRLPKDAYAGSGGASWRSKFRRLMKSERGWNVLALSISDGDWKNKTATYEYEGGGSTRIAETRWYRHLFVWAAIANAEDPTKVDLRYLGFRLHKMTDGSYRMLKMHWVDEPVPMLRKNLP